MTTASGSRNNRLTSGAGSHRYSNSQIEEFTKSAQHLHSSSKGGDTRVSSGNVTGTGYQNNHRGQKIQDLLNRVRMQQSDIPAE